ncbi:IS3 family transposase [Streptomyces sp. NPDC058686]|uniref:IS3 family transposase n=1 Tax=Streptomyces sp. NPDC058686 TaxID=3346599 RepID=UPI00365425B7
MRELRESGPVVTHKRVARLMRAAGITGRHLRKGKRTTVQNALVPKAPDLVGRDFTAPRTDVRWCDMTYLRVGDDWMIGPHVGRHAAPAAHARPRGRPSGRSRLASGRLRNPVQVSSTRAFLAA